MTSRRVITLGQYIAICTLMFVYGAGFGGAAVYGILR